MLSAEPGGGASKSESTNSMRPSTPTVVKTLRVIELKNVSASSRSLRLATRDVYCARAALHSRGSVMRSPSVRRTSRSTESTTCPYRSRRSTASPTAPGQSRPRNRSCALRVIASNPVRYAAKPSTIAAVAGFAGEAAVRRRSLLGLRLRGGSGLLGLLGLALLLEVRRRGLFLGLGGAAV